MQFDIIKEMLSENPDFLQSQLITYIGNKRALLPFIQQGIETVQNKLHKEKLNCIDVFSGSGIVARFLKQYSSNLTVNDLEEYSCIINRCYLSNMADMELSEIKSLYDELISEIDFRMEKIGESRKNGTYVHPGFISELYSPLNEEDIKKGERCFYTPYNANYLDVARTLINEKVPEKYRDFFIAPLLSEASIHANTAGIFKGFYKNSKTGTGQFGGNGKDALSRITGKIKLQFPVFSNNKSDFRVFSKDANELVLLPELYEQGIFDLAYFDPPYNQHPYGSNYFMLNLLAKYERPGVESISRVSGIPKNWNRSSYNKKKKVSQVFFDLVNNVKARFVLVSFNSEGFISKDEMISLLSSCGKVTVLESQYNTFRGSRNLSNRDIHVKEYLFLVEK
ncbi:MAG: DNA adenine methylase [Treponema sp.]|nr:DNA adenine methylase [Treponema sp.]